MCVATSFYQRPASRVYFFCYFQFAQFIIPYPLHVPRLKGISFETAIIERYRRRESSVEEALIEMYLAGVSVRRVEDITEALCGSKEIGRASCRERV